MGNIVSCWTIDSFRGLEGSNIPFDSPAERKQHFEEYGPHLRSKLQRIHELPDGYEFAFAPEAETFDLELRLDREGGLLWLRLTGREGVKDFIAAEFEPWFQASRGR